jgi:hypothetical protein
MGRPTLPLGKISFTVVAGARTRVWARTYLRDLDVEVRQITTFGPSKAAAERALKLALRDRITPGQSDITGESKVELLGRRWLDESPSDRSPNTKQTYLYVLENYVIPHRGCAAGTGSQHACRRPHT